MAEPAEKRWTVEEFLAWDDGSDRRDELVGGQIVAMAPPSEAHAAIVSAMALGVSGFTSEACKCANNRSSASPVTERPTSA